MKQNQEELMPIFRGHGEYNGDGENIHPVAQELADDIAKESLKATVKRSKESFNGRCPLSRRTIGLLNRDYAFAARIEAIAKLEQRDADYSTLAAQLEAAFQSGFRAGLAEGKQGTGKNNE